MCFFIIRLRRFRPNKKKSSKSRSFFFFIAVLHFYFLNKFFWQKIAAVSVTMKNLIMTNFIFCITKKFNYLLFFFSVIISLPYKVAFYFSWKIFINIKNAYMFFFSYVKILKDSLRTTRKNIPTEDSIRKNMRKELF